MPPRTDPASHAARILILDFGSQYTQLIARRIRELHVYCEIQPGDLALEAVEAFSPSGLVLSGGPSSVLDEDAPDFDPGLLGLGVPTLGICYGLQLMVQRLGGRVESAADREYGRAHLKIEKPDRLLAGLALAEDHVVWMSHGDRVLSLPPGFESVASSGSPPFAVVRWGERRPFGLQFPPQVGPAAGGGGQATAGREAALPDSVDRYAPCGEKPGVPPSPRDGTGIRRAQRAVTRKDIVAHQRVGFAPSVRRAAWASSFRSSACPSC